MTLKIENRKISTYTDLMKVIETLLYSNIGKDKVSMCASYPQIADPQNIKLPIITYKVKSKVPGSMKTTTEIKPRLRQSIVIDEAYIDNAARDVYTKEEVEKDQSGRYHPIADKSISLKKQDKVVIEVWGQMFDYYIDFDVWASNGIQADNLAEKFQSFMFTFTGYLKRLGVSDIFFEEMTSDENSSNLMLNLVNRTITYRIRIDTVVGTRVPLIEDIDIDAFLHKTSFLMDLNIGRSSIESDK